MNIGFKNAWKSYGILLMGIFLTLLIAFKTKNDIELQAKYEFELVCKEIKTKIITRLYTHALLLRSGASFFATSDTITRKDWNFFYENLKLERNMPGIQGFGFSLIVPGGKLQQHIDHVRQEGFPDFTVYPKGEREFYTSIIFLEPFRDRNLQAFGYDMYSESVRRAAMEKARDYDIASLSGKVHLVQETDTALQAGTLMYIPVYKKGMPTNTVEERRAAIIGWVYSPYRMHDLLQGILGNWDLSEENHINLHIYDDDNISLNSLLYDSQNNHTAVHADKSLLTVTIPIEFNGKKWTLLFSKPYEKDPFFQDKFLGVLVSGFIISLLLFTLSLSLFNTRTKAQKIAERLTSELKESETLLTETGKITKVGGWNYDIKNDNLNWTKELFNIHEVTPDYVPTTDKGLGFYHPESKKVLVQLFNDAIKHGTPFDLELKIITAKNNTKDVRVIGQTIKDANGEVIELSGSLQDITELKKAEQALLESEARFKAMFFEAPLGIALIHSDTGEIVEANEMFEKIVGRTIDELLKIDWMSITHPDDIQPDLDNMDLLNSGKISGFHMEKRYIHKNGEIVWINMTIASIKVVDKQNPLHLCMVEDITQRKQNELQLKETNQSLEEMVYITSHDLQSPLVSMEGYATELLNDYGDKFDAEGKYFLTRLKVNSQRMHSLILSLLDISRLNTKKNPYEKFKLNLIVEKIVLDLSLTIEQRNVKLKVGELPELFGDRQRIETVFRNLISNALNYGGKNIVIDTEQNIIYMKDDGIGIPVNQLERIFDPGERLKLNKVEGIGMGLTFCKKVILQHNGKIWAESEGENKGSTIKIILDQPTQNTFL